MTKSRAGMGILLALSYAIGCGGDSADLQAENTKLKAALAECQSSKKLAIAAAHERVSQPAQAAIPASDAGVEGPLVPDIAELIDHTERFKGKVLTLRLSVDDPPGTNGTLKDRVGRTARFYALSGMATVRLDISIAIPQGLDVPKATYSDEVTVTFLCGGALDRGNIAKAIER